MEMASSGEKNGKWLYRAGLCHKKFPFLLIYTNEWDMKGSLFSFIQMII